MAGRLPKKLFRVVALDPKGDALRWWEKGSKTYASESFAREHRANLEKKGLRAVIYVCYPEWVLLDPPKPLEGEEELPYEDYQA